MKMTILRKLLIIMLILTVIPLALLGSLALKDARDLGLDAADQARVMGQNAVTDSTTALNSLGEEMIKQKAVDVAKQLEIYIKDHPSMTIQDLQADEYFQAIAVQPVGETGYTAITDVDTLICRFHASEGVINLDLHNLAEKLPGFWSVMSQSEGGKEVYGYYDWAEADGSINQKYMHIAIVDAKTADGVTLSVAATTYIEEFSKPVKDTERKINSVIAATTSTIRNSTESVGTQNTILVLTLVTIIIVVIISSLFAKSVSDPIRKLKDAADKITSGEFDTELPPVKGSDEVTELTASMEMLITAFRRKVQAKPAPGLKKRPGKKTAKKKTTKKKTKKKTKKRKAAKKRKKK